MIIFMKKQLLYCLIALLLMQTYHVQAQRPLLNVSPSEQVHVKPSPPSDSYETLLLGIYIAVVGVMVARAVFIIIHKVSTLAKASIEEKELSPKLKPVDIEMGVEPMDVEICVKPMDIEMGVKPELVGSGACKPSSYSPHVVGEATQNFSPMSHIAGSVYRGNISGRDVVIKQMKGDVSQELKSLQKVEHDNLVKLQGFCITSEGKSYLIYEYVENGCLNLWLHKPPSMVKMGFTGFTWRTRLQIALDVATGLCHIHEHTGIVHRDLKSSNVLLNRKLRAKIANFGAARSKVNAATRYLKGTEGYMAPEYGVDGLVSPKIDVFAFGVILLELISGKETIVKDGKLRLLWTQIKALLEGHDREEKLRKWIDPNVQDTCSMDSAMSMALMAKACLEEDVEARPTMEEIVYKVSNLLDVCFEHLECS